MNEQLAKDARRLAMVGSFFIAAGWVFVVYALVAGLLWWIDLAQREAFDWLESLAISAAGVGLPLFVAFLVVGMGYFLRVFAVDVLARRS